MVLYRILTILIHHLISLFFLLFFKFAKTGGIAGRKSKKASLIGADGSQPRNPLELKLSCHITSLHAIDMQSQTFSCAYTVYAKVNLLRFFFCCTYPRLISESRPAIHRSHPRTSTSTLCQHEACRVLTISCVLPPPAHISFR